MPQNLPSMSIEASSDQLLQLLPVAIYTCNQNGRITMFNASARELWGSEPDLANKRWNGAVKIFNINGIPLADEESAMAIAFQTGEHQAEVIVERPDGTRLFVNEQAQAVYDAAGIKTGVVSVLTDITERKSAEQKAAIYTAIFESSEDAIISKNLNGIILSWNPSAERLFGYKAEEMIGQPIFKLIPVDRENEEPLIIERIVKGERVEHFETLRQRKDGKLIDISLTISPVKNNKGEIVGASKIARDITSKVGLNNALAKSEQRFRHMVMHSPVAMLVLRGPKFIVEIANTAYLEVVDRPAKDFVGRPLLEALPEVEAQGIGALLTDVLTTGIPFFGNEYGVNLMKNGKLEKCYFNFAYQPSYNLDGVIDGITVVANDVTTLVKSKHDLQESEKQFRNMVMQSPIAMTIFRGKDHIIEMANQEMFKNIWRKEAHEVIGRKALDVFPELNQQKYPELLKKVLTTGIAHRENAAIAYVGGNDGMKKFYLDYEYSPLFETDDTISGIMITVNDVTERINALHQLADAEARLRMAADGTGLATWDLNLKTRDIIYSPKLLELFGHPPLTVLTHEQLRKQLHPEDRKDIVDAAFEQALKTSQYFYEARILLSDHTVKWVRTLGKVYFDEQQVPQRMLGTMRDITREKIAQKAVEESEQRLNLAIDAAELGTWELNLKTDQLIYSKRYLQMFGLSNEEVMQHSDAFQYMHPDDRPIRNAAFEVALKSGFLDYETRLIWRDKTIKWIKAKGRVFYDDHHVPDRMLGTIQDITERKEIEEELEKRVKLRTAELQQVNLKLEHSNQELEQYAYVASHDLQEPLRKIRTYAGLLRQHLLGVNDSNSINTLDKVIKSAERMSILIYDLLNFSRLLKPETSFESTDLNNTLKDVLSDLELVIQQKQAVITYESLPTLNAIPLQMGQLFYNLVNNSLKFSRNDIVPVIHITSKKVTVNDLPIKSLNPELDYYQITVTDNGIGFEQENAEQIFEVFKRLHNKTAYPGSGIGLALCRKIALNHQGDIAATSEEGKGATFHILLPLAQQS